MGTTFPFPELISTIRSFFFPQFKTNKDESKCQIYRLSWNLCVHWKRGSEHPRPKGMPRDVEEHNVPQKQKLFCRGASYPEPIGQGTRLGQEPCVLLHPSFIQDMENTSFPIYFFQTGWFGGKSWSYLGGEVLSCSRWRFCLGNEDEKKVLGLMSRNWSKVVAPKH